MVDLAYLRRMLDFRRDSFDPDARCGKKFLPKEALSEWLSVLHAFTIGDSRILVCLAVAFLSYPEQALGHACDRLFM